MSQPFGIKACTWLLKLLHLILLCPGDSEWQIDDPRTWRDPNGEDKEDPIGDTDSLYLQVRERGDHDKGHYEDYQGKSSCKSHHCRVPLLYVQLFI